MKGDFFTLGIFVTSFKVLVRHTILEGLLFKSCLSHFIYRYVRMKCYVCIQVELRFLFSTFAAPTLAITMCAFQIGFPSGFLMNEVPHSNTWVVVMYNVPPCVSVTLLET